MSVTVRAATPADLDAVVEVNRCSATTAYAPIFVEEPFPLAAVRSRFERLIRADAEVLVAEEGGAIVGFVVASPGFLEALYVVPEAWGRGVGSLLADRAEEIAGARAALWVLERNDAGRRFWERRGWAAAGGAKEEHGQVELRYARAAAAASWSATR